MDPARISSPSPPSPVPFEPPLVSDSSRSPTWALDQERAELFLEGLQRFGKSWKKISSLVHTRTLVQIRTHAQKYLQKQSRAAIKNDAKAAGPSTSQEWLLQSDERVPDFSQWVQRLVPPGSYSNKRRRVETSTSTAVAVPTFQPLPAPDNLSSPRTSPQLALYY
ncbi:Myb domain [Phytophthora cactorum]|nr:Myb domain [Phytophthora cactorum]